MKIICVGRNYSEHAKELNNQIPEEPVLFLKPETALIPKKQPFFYPSFSENIHFEAEIVVRIDRLGKNIAPQFAHKYYNQISLGIDFTARDIQQRLKEKALPWERAKAFDSSAPVGTFIDKRELKDLNNLNFSLHINQVPKQSGNTKDMLFDIDTLIAEISKYFTLKIGDLIFTGTPAGVGPVKIGDHLEGYIENRQVFNLKVR